MVVKKIFYKFISSVFTLFILSTFVFAGNTKVTASVDAKKIGIDDAVTLSITVEGSDSMGAQIVRGPASNDFRVISGPNVSTSFNFVNGTTSMTKTFSFVFAPLKKGILKIPSVTVRAGNRNYETKTITVTVVKGSLRQGQTSTTPFGFNSPFGSLFDQGPFDRRQQSKTRGTDLGKDVFLKLEVDRKEIYTGQPVTLTLWIYYRRTITRVALEKEGKIEGFWSEDVDLSKLPNNGLVTKDINGLSYYAQPVKRWLLFPTGSGTFTLGPWSLKIVVRIPPRSFFDFGREQAVIKTSNTVKLNVKPFPQKGRPMDFSGLCGHFTLSSNVDKREVPEGGAVKLTVVLKGEGNMKSAIELPVLHLPDFKVYTPKAQEDVKISGGTFKGRKIWTYIIVPLKVGNFVIPGVHISYFDIVDKQYKILSTKEINIMVTAPESIQTEPEGAGLAQVNSAAPIRMKGRDILYIDTDVKGATYITVEIYNKTWFVLFFPIIFLLSFVTIYFDEKKKRLMTNKSEWVKIQAIQKAKKELKKCNHWVSKSDEENFFKHLLHAIQYWIEGRFGLQSIEITENKIRQVMSEAGYEKNVIEKFIWLLNVCQSYRYAPEVKKGLSIGDIYKETKLLLSEMEAS